MNPENARWSPDDGWTPLPPKPNHHPNFRPPMNKPTPRLDWEAIRPIFIFVVVIVSVAGSILVLMSILAKSDSYNRGYQSFQGYVHSAPSVLHDAAEYTCSYLDTVESINAIGNHSREQPGVDFYKGCMAAAHDSGIK